MKEFWKNVAYELLFWALLVLGCGILVVVGIITTFAIMDK